MASARWYGKSWNQLNEVHGEMDVSVGVASSPDPVVVPHHEPLAACAEHVTVVLALVQDELADEARAPWQLVAEAERADLLLPERPVVVKALAHCRRQLLPRAVLSNETLEVGRLIHSFHG